MRDVDAQPRDFFGPDMHTYTANRGRRDRRATAALLSGAAVALTMATPAHAQQSAEVQSNPADIIVTARRTEERLQDVPISITVYDQEQLANRNVASTADLATFTPSLAINQRFGAEKAFFALRGFTQEPNTAPSVGVAFADVVAPRLSIAIGGGNGAGPGNMMDLQNVQVLKGPQGTLQGRNTTGGLIMLVPQKPTPFFEGYIEGTLGNYNAKRVQGAVNLPLADTFHTRIAFDRNTRDGYLRNRYDLGGVGPKDFADLNYTALRLSIVGELTPNLENYLIVTYADSDTNGYLARPAVCNENAIGGRGEGAFGFQRAAQCAALAAREAAGAGYWDVTNSVRNPYEKQRTWQIINTTTWNVSDTLTVKNIASYGQARVASNQNIEGDIIARPFVILQNGQNGPHGQMWTATEELQFQGNTLDGSFNWQAGAYLEISEPLGLEEQHTAVFLPECPDLGRLICQPGSSNSVAHRSAKFQNYAVYAQGTYDFTDTLSLTLGARYTWDDILGFSNDYRVESGPNGIVLDSPRMACNPASNLTPTDPAERARIPFSDICYAETRIKSQEPTWLIGLDYKPTPDLLVYAKYSRGYRAGGVNMQAYNVDPRVDASSWEPEKVDAYEVGVKTTLRGDAVRGTFNVAAFYNDFTNQQVTGNIPNCTNEPGCSPDHPLIGINGIFNVGVSEIKGVEVESSLVILDNLRFDLGYTYLDAKVKDAVPPPCNPAFFLCDAAAFPVAGDELPLSPKNRITITGTYTLPLDPSIGEISVGATFTHTDEQYFTHSGDNAFAIGAIPFNTSLLPATDLLNLNLNWKDVAGQPIDLALFATNVTNLKYWVSNTNALSSTGADFIQLGAPQMYGARLKFRFGTQ